MTATPTSQGAAIYQVGCEREDGLLNIHAESETCEVCAATDQAGAPAEQILMPKWAGYFHSYQDWVNKAQSRLASPDHRRAICVDAKGRRCAIGRDFMLARDEGAFPVRYFWECELVAAPAGAQQADKPLSDAEFLAKRLSRVAKLVGVHIPEHFTHEQIAETAGTILGDVARRLENRAQQAGDDAARDAVTPAARDVLAERRRQVEKEGWTPEHDDAYHKCELARAAATYATCSHIEQLKLCGEQVWPWHPDWWKRSTYRNDLVKAGALLLAEIDRIDRAAMPAQANTAGKDGGEA